MLQSRSKALRAKASQVKNLKERKELWMRALQLQKTWNFTDKDINPSRVNTAGVNVALISNAPVEQRYGMILRMSADKRYEIPSKIREETMLYLRANVKHLGQYANHTPDVDGLKKAYAQLALFEGYDNPPALNTMYERRDRYNTELVISRKSLSTGTTDTERKRHNANIIFFNKLLKEVAIEVRLFGEGRTLDHVHYWRTQPCTLVDLILQIVDDPMFKREIGILIVQYGRSENANNLAIGGHRAAQF